MQEASESEEGQSGHSDRIYDEGGVEEGKGKEGSGGVGLKCAIGNRRRGSRSGQVIRSVGAGWSSQEGITRLRSSMDG